MSSRREVAASRLRGCTCQSRYQISRLIMIYRLIIVARECNPCEFAISDNEKQDKLKFK
jgi:hypothetical protein